MLFSTKKKLQRDRKAGLVFRWRGGYGSNRGGFTIAFLITAMVFTAGFVMLNVYAKQTTVPSRYRAAMIQLGEMDDELTWWVEKNSPNMPLWSDNGDELSDTRVSVLLRDKLRESRSKSYRFEDVEMQELTLNNEGHYTLYNSSLPKVERHKGYERDRVGDLANVPNVNWKLKITVSDTLKPRLSSLDESNYEKWIPEEWRGDSVRFIIALDHKGEVVSVNPAEWNENITLKDFENWIYTIRFKPAKRKKSQIVTGVINLTVVPFIQDTMREEQL